MDTTTSLILTVTINALVTGVIIFLFQKRVERREATKAFQEQTKFKRFHEKRAETLEALYPKFRLFSDELNNLLQVAFIGTNEFEVDPAVLEDIKKNMQIFGQYLDDNKILLETKEAYDLHNIYWSFHSIHAIISFLYVDPHKVTEDTIEIANDLIKRLPEIKPVNPKDPKYVALAVGIYNQTRILVEQVEAIYRKIH